MDERDFGTPGETNPKHEIRNPKQIQNANVRMFKTAVDICIRDTTRRTHLFVSFEFLSFWFVSDFGFRISLPAHVTDSCTVMSDGRDTVPSKSDFAAHHTAATHDLHYALKRISVNRARFRACLALRGRWMDG